MQLNYYKQIFLGLLFNKVYNFNPIKINTKNQRKG